MTIQFNLELEFEDPKIPEQFQSIVSPELGEKFEKRSVTSITFNKNKLMVGVQADDWSALRSSVNHYLKLLELFEDIISLEE